MGDPTGGLALILVVGALYFFPLIMACLRHNQRGTVLVLNLFLGWTVLGWIIAFAIAMSDKRQAVVINNVTAPPSTSSQA